MKRRNWTLIVLSFIGLTLFFLSRTVWGPPGKAHASETAISEIAPAHDEETSEAERRYLSNQPRHWRYVMLKRN